MTRLDGQVAVVTGAARGIGEAIARRFVSEGARVVVGDIDADGVRRVAQDLGGSAAWRCCDVTREDDVDSLVAAATEEFGRVDTVVNNAGALGARGSILGISTEEWDATMNLLLRSVFFGMRAGGRALVSQGEGGCIISTASIAAHSPGNGPHAYGTAKAGVVHLTQRVALELGEHRIRVNAICPGGIVTALVCEALGVGVEAAPSLEPVAAAMRPYPRAGSVDDVAAAAAWLAGPDGEFVTGQAITVDGGESVGPKWADQAVR